MVKGAVVIPAYGMQTMTHAVVRDCLREPDVVDVLIVDNMGDYESISGEVTLRPSRNLGWLRGTNYGFDYARQSASYDFVVALNNDTRLSEGFFSGLRTALERAPGLLAPCYDDIVLAQRAYYSGPVEDFTPEDTEIETKLVDGTCFALTEPTLAKVGFLDDRRFGRRGWGAMEDLCLRISARGLPILITRRAYLTHARGSTARAVHTAYERYAYAEMRRGMRKKWGSEWRSRFDPETVGSGSRADDRRDLLRMFEDRLGLSGGWIGRR